MSSQNGNFMSVSGYDHNSDYIDRGDRESEIGHVASLNDEHSINDTDGSEVSRGWIHGVVKPFTVIKYILVSSQSTKSTLSKNYDQDILLPNITLEEVSPKRVIPSILNNSIPQHPKVTLEIPQVLKKDIPPGLFSTFYSIPRVYISNAQGFSAHKQVDIPNLFCHNRFEHKGYNYTFGGLFVSETSDLSYLGIPENTPMSKISVHFPTKLPPFLSLRLLANPLIRENNQFYKSNPMRNTLTSLDYSIVPSFLSCLESAKIDDNYIFFFGGFSIHVLNVEYIDDRWLIYKKLVLNHHGYILDLITFKSVKIDLGKIGRLGSGIAACAIKSTSLNVPERSTTPVLIAEQKRMDEEKIFQKKVRKKKNDIDGLRNSPDRNDEDNLDTSSNLNSKYGPNDCYVEALPISKSEDLSSNSKGTSMQLSKSDDTSLSRMYDLSPEVTKDDSKRKELSSGHQFKSEPLVYSKSEELPVSKGTDMSTSKSFDSILSKHDFIKNGSSSKTDDEVTKSTSKLSNSHHNTKPSLQVNTNKELPSTFNNDINNIDSITSAGSNNLTGTSAVSRMLSKSSRLFHRHKHVNHMPLRNTYSKHLEKSRLHTKSEDRSISNGEVNTTHSSTDPKPVHKSDENKKEFNKEQNKVGTVKFEEDEGSPSNKPPSPSLKRVELNSVPEKVDKIPNQKNVKISPSPTKVEYFPIFNESRDEKIFKSTEIEESFSREEMYGENLMKSGIGRIKIYVFGGFIEYEEEEKGEDGEVIRNFKATNELICVEIPHTRRGRLFHFDNTAIVEKVSQKTHKIWPSPRGYFAKTIIDNDEGIGPNCEMNILDLITQGRQKEESVQCTYRLEGKLFVIHGGINEDYKSFSEFYVLNFDTGCWKEMSTYSFDYFNTPRQPFEDDEITELTKANEVKNPELKDAELRACHHTLLYYKNYLIVLGGFRNDLLRHYDSEKYYSDKYDVSKLTKFPFATTNNNSLRLPVLNLKTQTWKYVRFFYDLDKAIITENYVERIERNKYWYNAGLANFCGSITMTGKNIIMAHGLVIPVTERYENFKDMKKELPIHLLLLGGNIHLSCPGL